MSMNEEESYVKMDFFCYYKSLDIPSLVCSFTGKTPKAIAKPKKAADACNTVSESQ